MDAVVTYQRRHADGSETVGVWGPAFLEEALTVARDKIDQGFVEVVTEIVPECICEVCSIGVPELVAVVLDGGCHAHVCLKCAVYETEWSGQIP